MSVVRASTWSAASGVGAADALMARALATRNLVKYIVSSTNWGFVFVKNWFNQEVKNSNIIDEG